MEEEDAPIAPKQSCARALLVFTLAFSRSRVEPLLACAFALIFGLKFCAFAFESPALLVFRDRIFVLLQNETGGTGQAERDRQNMAGRQDRQNWTGRTGQVEQDSQDRNARTLLPGQVCQDRTARRRQPGQKKKDGTARKRQPE